MKKKEEFNVQYFSSRLEVHIKPDFQMISHETMVTYNTILQAILKKIRCSIKRAFQTS